MFFSIASCHEEEEEEKKKRKYVCVFTNLVPGHGAQESLAVLLCHDLVVVVGETLFPDRVVMGAEWLSVMSSHSLFVCGGSVGVYRAEEE